MSNPTTYRNFRAEAPAIDEIAACDRRELHALARIINATTEYRSRASVASALNGWRTRNTKRYPGNQDYFDKVRQLAIELCEARSAGTPWPQIVEAPKAVASDAIGESSEILIAKLRGQIDGLREGAEIEIARLQGEITGLREGMAILRDLIRRA